jgi:RNA polymerase sigma factor (sigma-70 family)
MIASTRDVIASPPPYAPYELQPIVAGDQHACRELIAGWETPIKAIAWGYASRRSDIDDLMQCGRLAVYQSALNYDPSFEITFGHYTKRAIKNSVLKEAARLARQRRLETPLEWHAEKEDKLPEHMMHRAGQAQVVKEWLLQLPEPHATIFRLLYVEKVKQRAAAQEMGVSQPRVAQLNKSFLNLARETLLS